MNATGAVVMVVEDDTSTRNALKRLLEASALSCETYDSAETFLASGDLAVAGCIVCDLRLPAMSGFDLMRRLREMGEALPFIVITAFDEAGVRKEAVQLGVDGYFVKPFQGSELVEAIRSALEACRRHGA